MRRVLTVGGVLTVTVCALAWLFLAPAKLGGQTTYVVTHGISMQPKFHTGDLAILRAQPSYHVGQVVAYRSATLHTVVMHRIVAENDGRFTFKGDNNSWTDPDHPTQADLLGSLAMRLPQGGRYLGALHSTSGRAIAGGVLALIVLGGAGSARRRRALRTSGRRANGRHLAGRHRATPPLAARSAHRAARTSPQNLGPAIALPDGEIAHAVNPMGVVSQPQFMDDLKRPQDDRFRIAAGGQLVAAALVLIACLGGEAWLAKLPATMPTTRTVVVDQSGTFGYSATVPSSVVYPTGKVTAGDPIFTQIVRVVNFSFDYKADPSVAGTVRLSAALVGPSGWTMPLATGPAEPVRAGNGKATVRVDLAAEQAALDQFTKATGVQATSTSLVITPTVEAKGSVAGQRVDASYTGDLAMAASAKQLTVMSTSDPSSSTGDTRDKTNPLVVTSPISAKVATSGPRLLSALGHHVGLRTARIAVGAGAVAALGWLIALLVGSRRTGRAEDDVVSALRQYGDRIVDAESIPLDGPVVDLTSLAALHSVAERYDRVILHTVRGERHSYVVRDELSWYRYDVRPDRGAHAAPRRAERGAALTDSVISLQPRLRTATSTDILPGGVGAAAWADGYARAS